MSDKCSYHGNPQELIDKMNKREVAMMKSAYETLMEKKKLHTDITMYFTDELCVECKCPIYTSERPILWCKDGCINNGKRKPDDKDYMKFVKENCR